MVQQELSELKQAYDVRKSTLKRMGESLAWTRSAAERAQSELAGRHARQLFGAFGRRTERIHGRC